MISVFLKTVISVSFCLAAASANALDVSGIKLGSRLEEAKTIMLSLNKGYNNPSFSNMDVSTIDGAPVGYRATAPCVGVESYAACDETAIFQERGSAVWFVARYQRYPDPKNRFPASDLVSMLKKKYGLDSMDSLNVALPDGGKFYNGKYLWAYDRSGKLRTNLVILQPMMGKQGDLGPCNLDNATLRTIYGNNTLYPSQINNTCGQYVVAGFESDENGFVQAFKVEAVDIAHIYDATMRHKQAAEEAQKRESDAQRAKGLKPNL